MADYLTHYYLRDKEPFQSLSSLCDEEAIRIMEELRDDTPFGNRFKNPLRYLADRKETEKWVREGFIAKGGKPLNEYPIPMVFGSSQWMVDISPDPSRHAEIHVPISEFTDFDVSFTYPDSMISRWFGREKPAEYYQPELHGKIFTLSEILAIIEEKGLPEEDWGTNLPGELAPYIEAQVWRHEILEKYKKQAAEK